MTIIEDLLELTHWLTRIKLAPESAAAQDVPEAERVRGRRMADRLGMADVTRAWQMLLKGLSEARLAPVPLHATEMVLIRLAYASQLPSPAEALEALVGGNTAAPRSVPAGGSPPAGGASSAGSVWNDPSPQGAPVHTFPSQGSGSWSSRASPGGARPAVESAASLNPSAAPLARRPLPPKLVEADSASISPAPNPLAAAAAPPPGRLPASFADVVDLARDRHEGMLHGYLMTDVHLVRFEPGRVELRLGAHAAADLPQRLSRFLLAETGKPWLVTVSHEAGEPSLHEQQTALQAAQLAEVSAHPLVSSIFEMFPGSVIQRITIEPPPPADAGEAIDVTDGVEPVEDTED